MHLGLWGDVQGVVRHASLRSSTAGELRLRAGHTHRAANEDASKARVGSDSKGREEAFEPAAEVHAASCAVLTGGLAAPPRAGSSTVQAGCTARTAPCDHTSPWPRGSQRTACRRRKQPLLRCWTRPQGQGLWICSNHRGRRRSMFLIELSLHLPLPRDPLPSPHRHQHSWVGRRSLRNDPDGAETPGARARGLDRPGRQVPDRPPRL